MHRISNLSFNNNNNISLKGSYNYPKQLNCNYDKYENYTNEYMSSDISSASRAYGLSYISRNNTIPQLSLKDMVKWLEAHGKIEGKDFYVDSSCTMGNTLLILKNKHGQEELCIHYDDGNHDSWNCYEFSEYKNGKLSKRIDRDFNGNISCISQVFDKNDVAVSHLINEELTYDTTPLQFENYLKGNNIDYKIEYLGEEDNNRSLKIDILDKNKQVTKKVWYYYGENKFDEHCQFVCQSDINKKGEEYRRLMMDKDNVKVVTYVNYL